MPDKKLTKKQLKKLMAATPEGSRMSDPVTNCVCPICKKSGWAYYPYGEFVIRHEHPVRRYWYWLRTGRKYSVWLSQYWSDMEQLTGKTRKDYA